MNATPQNKVLLSETAMVTQSELIYVVLDIANISLSDCKGFTEQ